MTQIRDYAQYAQAVRNAVAAVHPTWENEPAPVHVFENAVVVLGATITDSTAAQTWVSATTSAVLAAFS